MNKGSGVGIQKMALDHRQHKRGIVNNDRYN